MNAYKVAKHEEIFPVGCCGHGFPLGPISTQEFWYWI